MLDLLTGALMLIGASFMLIASLGVLRLPDLFLRMSASTKAATIGTGSVLLAAAVYFGEVGVTSRALATIVFLLLTTPIAAHMLGRAGYFSGVALSDLTLIDELRGQYDPLTHRLDCVEPAPTLPPRPADRAPGG